MNSNDAALAHDNARRKLFQAISDETTSHSTDETPSHSTRLPKDGNQVAGYKLANNAS